MFFCFCFMARERLRIYNGGWRVMMWNDEGSVALFFFLDAV